MAYTAGDRHIQLYTNDTILFSTNSSFTVTLSLLQASFDSLQHAISNHLHLVLIKKMGRNLPQFSSLDIFDIKFANCYKYLSFGNCINATFPKVK